MLQIKNLRKAYGKYQALDGLSMEVKEGALYGFVGPNGAGKTTTIKILAGLLAADSGQVLLDGENALGRGRKLKGKIGYVPDEFGTYDNLKVREYMEFFASCYGMEGLVARNRCSLLLEQVGLEDRMDFYVDGLSRGMKQRLCLAQALIHDPPLLLLLIPVLQIPCKILTARLIGTDPIADPKRPLIRQKFCPDSGSVQSSRHHNE